MDRVFDLAFEQTLGHEGGYSNDRDDRGNWTSGKVGVGELKGTKYGISSMSYPNLDIKNLTLNEAKEIYKKDYWAKMHCDLVKDYSVNIAVELFDTGINAGIFAAQLFLQEALNLSNRNQKDYQDITEDGWIGNETISALKKVKNTDFVYNMMNFLQAEHYINLMRKKEVYEKYIGWFNRVNIVKT